MGCLPHLHVAAIHADAEQRSFTPGLGVLCRENDFMLGAGVFQNSIGKLSKYASVSWQPVHAGPVKIGAFGGVIDDYLYKNGGAFLFGGAIASAPTSWGELHFTFVPQVPGVSVAALGISMSFKTP